MNSVEHISLYELGLGNRMKPRDTK